MADPADFDVVAAVGTAVGTGMAEMCIPLPEETAEVAWWAYAFVVVLIMMSGMFSGLTLGLMGLDLNGLEIVISGGEPKEVEWAKRIKPVRANGNLLLCTLLLGNVGVNAALSILMADMAGGLTGFLVSTFVIVIFGEIIPQAVCSRHPLAIGAASVPIVKLLMWLMFVMTWPISKVLNIVLGAEIGTIYNKDELRKLIALHQSAADGGVDAHEGRVMMGALDFGQKKVHDIMTSQKNVFKITNTAELDFELLSDIFRSGYSRIPVYGNINPHHDRDEFVGLLFVKDLILLDPSERIPVTTLLNFYGREVPRVYPDTPLHDMLNIFKSGRSHLAVVHDIVDDGQGDPYHVDVGLVTLEDIIEVIIQDEIVDETDVFIDVETRETVDRKAMDPRQLALFSKRGRSLPQVLTPQEASAIHSHLIGIVPVFQIDQRRLSADRLKLLIVSSTVIEVTVPERKKAEDGTEIDATTVTETAAEKRDVSEGGLYLYRRGTPSEYMTLVLDGEVSIRAGRAGFKSTVGRWGLLADDCIRDVDMDIPVDDGTSGPDARFTFATTKSTAAADSSSSSLSAPAAASERAAETSPLLSFQRRTQKQQADGPPEYSLQPRSRVGSADSAGSVEDRSGKDKASTTTSSSSGAVVTVSAPDAAVDDDEQHLELALTPYVPDFSAKCVRSCRLLRVSRRLYADHVVRENFRLVEDSDHAVVVRPRTNSVSEVMTFRPQSKP